jgi:hypothetical protein
MISRPEIIPTVDQPDLVTNHLLARDPDLARHVVVKAFRIVPKIVEVVLLMDCIRNE